LIDTNDSLKGLKDLVLGDDKKLKLSDDLNDLNNGGNEAITKDHIINVLKSVKDKKEWS